MRLLAMPGIAGGDGAGWGDRLCRDRPVDVSYRRAVDAAFPMGWSWTAARLRGGGIRDVRADRDGSKLNFTLAEVGQPKLPRTFQLTATWRGPTLVLDDEKSMYMHFLPGGRLTPAPTYSSPVPDKHAHATIAWGTLDDFQAICNSLAAARRGER